MSTAILPFPTSPSTAPAEERVADALGRIVRATRLSTHAIEQQTGVSGAQRFVLEQLRQRPARSMRELADRTMTDISSVSAVVRRLEDRGLVAREPSPAGGRRVTLSLTTAGVEAVAQLRPTAQARLLDGLRQLTVEERETLAIHLERWMDAANGS